MESTFSRRQFLQGTISSLALAMFLPREVLATHEKKHTFNDYIEALIQVESNGNPRAERYEKHLRDWSYGLGQILTKTAKELERRYPDLPRIGNKPEQIKKSLFDPKINRVYTETLFKEELDFYGDPFLAVAAYNAGHLAPRNARSQEQLNDLYKTFLTTDGRLGKASRLVVKRFQKDNLLKTDGRLNSETYSKLQSVWTANYIGKPNPLGIIPNNKYTPNHVRRFKRALGIKD